MKWFPNVCELRHGILEKGAVTGPWVPCTWPSCIPRLSSARKTLDIGKGADGLGLGFLPRGVDPRDVTKAVRIEDRRRERSKRTGLKTSVRFWGCEEDV